ncbi:MAG: BlaI/MecI/CopY family transcriptional regulator [Clostridiaceae bacterium]|nr:BlaI/MecI/CopY family transcriptional regulator [Clostridiaceae bacterium]
MDEIQFPDYNMTEAERKFADLIWKNEPINSGDLVRLCADRFAWKKSTTYTFLKKLCDQRLFQNIDATVSSLISKDEYLRIQSEQFVETNFGGSIPRFLAAFVPKKKISKAEYEEIMRIINEYEEEK